MNKSVIIETGRAICALGALDQSIELLLEGKSGVKPGPSFGYPVAHASFKDLSLRDPATAFRFLFSRIDLSSADPARTVFIYCSAKGDLSQIDKSETSAAGPERALLDSQARLALSVAAFSPARTSVISCACASGAVAVEYAKELLEREQFTTAIIAGFDVQSRFVTSGFHSLGALSPDGARPFDKSRNGLTLGDGAAVMVLSHRQANPGDFIIAGAGSANDANHRTGPSRTGDGLHRAAAAALDNAEMNNDRIPCTIGAIKCHGTATVYNDAMEAKAIYRLFQPRIPPCFSLKGAIGHTSGVGSLLEIAAAAEFLKRKCVPPTIGFSEPGIDDPLPVSNKMQRIDGDSILCLAAGFGGINAAVIVKECR